MSEKIWYLKCCQLFQYCSPDQIRLLEACSRVRTFPKRSPVYLPAEQAESVLLLASGRIKICHLTPDGKQSILAFIDPGEIFGELAVLEPGPRDEYAETVERSKVISIPGTAVTQLMQEHPDLCLGITKLIGLRRRRIERRVKNLLFLSNRDRLVHLLLELAEQYGLETERGVELEIGLSHQDLANIVGSTRETVTVVLGTLQTEGYVRVGRRQLILRRIDKLARLVGMPPVKLPTPREESAAIPLNWHPEMG